MLNAGKAEHRLNTLFLVAVVILLCSDADLIFTELTLLSIWVPVGIEVWMREFTWRVGE